MSVRGLDPGFYRIIWGNQTEDCIIHKDKEGNRWISSPRFKCLLFEDSIGEGQNKLVVAWHRLKMPELHFEPVEIEKNEEPDYNKFPIDMPIKDRILHDAFCQIGQQLKQMKLTELLDVVERLSK